MSIRKLITQFNKRVARDPFLQNVSDDQRRGFLAVALSTLSDEKPIENHYADVAITAGEVNVVLPLDYRNAEEAALLAVEYGYSALYAADLGFDVDLGNYQISRPVAGYNTKLKYLQPTPAPRVTEENIYGVSRKVLKLHNTFSAERTELLIYRANYFVDDRKIKITLTENFNNGDTVEITVRTSAGDTAYTYMAASGAAGDNEFKIGQSIAATLDNLADLITADTDSGLTAEAEGQIISIFGTESEVDFTVEISSDATTIEDILAYNNLDSSAAARIYQLMESQYYDYLATDPAYNNIISDSLRNIYFQKAERLRAQALDNLTPLTI